MRALFAIRSRGHFFNIAIGELEHDRRINDICFEGVGPRLSRKQEIDAMTVVYVRVWPDRMI